MELVTCEDDGGLPETDNEEQFTDSDPDPEPPGVNWLVILLQSVVLHDVLPPLLLQSLLALALPLLLSEGLTGIIFWNQSLLSSSVSSVS